MQLSIVVFFFLADFPLSTEDEVEQRGTCMVTQSTADPVWCFVRLCISWKLSAKSIEVPLASKFLATLSLSLSGSKYIDLTPARTCQDRRKLFVHAMAGREMLGVPSVA